MSKKDKKKIVILSLIFIFALVNFFVEKYQEQHKDNVEDSVVGSISSDELKQTDQNFNYAHFLDVGQGDSTLIETSKGKYILIDTSTGASRQKLVSYLEEENVEEIEYLILTHPHEDHIGCADEVIDNYYVKNVLMNDKVEATSAYERLVDSLKESKAEKGTKIINPAKFSVFNVDDIEITILSNGQEYDDLNDSSICVKVESGTSTLLFTGDAEKKVEKDLLNAKVDVSAEIYKCAHHGSSTSNSNDFLDAVNPEIAVISCGLDNMYGHPHDEVEEALLERNIEVYRTFEDGDIVIAFDEDSIFKPVE